MDEKEFEHKLENDGGRYLLEYCYKKLTKEQKDIAFDDAINNNYGLYLLEFCYKKLTKEQKDIAVDNAINNNYGGYVLKIFYEKLTAKQKKITKYCDENLKKQQILSSVKTCIKILLNEK
jgi:hypothetical protein